jgi:hypothetical protein
MARYSLDKRGRLWVIREKATIRFNCTALLVRTFSRMKGSTKRRIRRLTVDNTRSMRARFGESTGRCVRASRPEDYPSLNGMNCEGSQCQTRSLEYRIPHFEEKAQAAETETEFGRWIVAASAKISVDQPHDLHELEPLRLHTLINIHLIDSMFSKVFSIQGRGLHLDTAADIEPHLRDLRAVRDTVEEIHLGGNTLGVEASLALSKVLKELTALKVSPLTMHPD